MLALGRSILVRGKGCAHDSIQGLSFIHVPFLSGADADKRKGIVMTDRTERPPSAFRLNLEQQKNRAKDLLRAAKSGDANALSRLAAAVSRDSVARHSPEPLHATAKLADAQFAIARELRFANWAELKTHIASMDRQRAAIDAKSPALDGDLKTLHIRCGHDIQEPLAQAGFIGDFFVHAFPYITAPLRNGSRGLELMARHLVESHLPPGTPYEEELERLRGHEKKLHTSAEDYERVVIWMEHDSWDQLILTRLLAHYANAKRPRVLELIVVDTFPGSQRFLGLGQLPPEALRLIWPRRKPVTAAQLALANEAWLAVTSDDPRPLAALARSGTPALPIMAPALHRHLRELPSVGNGLRLTEQLILEILRERSDVPLYYVWSQLTLRRDPLPYNTDLSFIATIRQMLAVSEPVITLGPEPVGKKPPFSEKPFGQPVAITQLGEAVLRGEHDWLTLHPPARWTGGVYVEPGIAGWRWDETMRDAVVR